MKQQRLLSSLVATVTAPSLTTAFLQSARPPILIRRASPLSIPVGTFLFLTTSAYNPKTTFAQGKVNLSMSVNEMNSSSSQANLEVDPEYPGTAVQRLKSVHERVASLTMDDLNGSWEDVRRKLLWSGGLKDLPNAIPGEGYTGHSFNDYNHVDLTTMNDEVSNNKNDGQISEIAVGNFLGNGIRTASIPELGPGGSWSTCSNGCHVDPPQDVAHVQFRSRIAFKLVWVPNNNFDSFVLVDDDGKELGRGKPTGQLPPLNHRKMNYKIVSGSKYGKVAAEIAMGNEL